MNNISKFTSRYWQFTFLGKVRSTSDIIDIDEVNIEQPSERKISTEKRVKVQIIIQINRLLMGVCILSFLFIIIYPFVYPDKVVPDLIKNSFLLTLGWFGGIFSAFFQVDQKINS